MTDRPWTPGPWIVDADWPNNLFPSYELISGGIGKPQEHRALANVVVRVDGHDYAQGAANARLIAASPDMYEALDRLLSPTMMLGIDPAYSGSALDAPAVGIVDQNRRAEDEAFARAAMAKAMGEE